jgi:Tetratricopeptide repeat
MRRSSSLPADLVRERSANVSHLLSPFYLGALGGLLLNDHVLKQAFPGVVTGILSDFLGLFAFAVFLSVALPRWAFAVHGATGLAFVVWKSPLSDVVIQSWNAAMPVRIARAVDYWDLLALSVLPVSMGYLRRSWPALAPASARTIAVAMVSLFAFTATSMPPHEHYIVSGREHARKGDYDRAIQQFDEAIKIFPQSAEALYQRGVAKLKRGDTADGEADIAKAAAIEPKYAPLAPSQCSTNC